MNFVLEYIKYWWKAKDRHGIHSPFVYKLSDIVFKQSIDSEFQLKRAELYRYLSHEERVVNRIDLGAGSKKFSATTSVKSIFTSSSSKGKTADLLYRISKVYQPKITLELGTNLGIGTIHLAQGNPNEKVISVEGCPNTAEIARKNMTKMDCKNVSIITSDFTSFLQENNEMFDLVFIDGHHDGEALLNYLSQLAPFIKDETIIILDDIRWSSSMLSAWERIKEDQHFHLTIDLFRCGIVMKRHHQEKEHFILKY